MMNRVWLGLVVVLGLASLAVAQVPALKIGVVDGDQVVQNSVEGKKVIAKLEKLKAAKQADIDKAQKELTDLQVKLQTQQATLAPDALEKLAKDADAKSKTFRRMQEDAQKELDDFSQTEFEGMDRTVMTVILAYAKDNGYSIVFDKNRSGIIASSNAMDISADIIKLLDQQAQAAPAK